MRTQQFIESVRGPVEAERRRFRGVLSGKRARAGTLTEATRRALDSDPPASLDVHDDDAPPVIVRVG